MSKELEYLREDYQNAKNIVEANNKILEELLQEPLVRLYRDTCIQNEGEKKKLETLGFSLAIQEMTECEHIFVKTETIREPIYHCLKCGLTNGYAVKKVNPRILNIAENNMEYIFKETKENGIILNKRSTCPLDIAKEIYEEIQNNTKNLDLSNDELQMCFLVALSKNDPTYYQDLSYQIKKLAGFEIKEEQRIIERIQLRLRNIPTVEAGITCYEVSDFSKDLFKFIMTIEKRAGAEFTSIEDISKYPDLVNEELEKISEEVENTKFDVMAIPSPRAFVIAPDKWKEFLNSKPNPETIKRNEEIAKKFRVNNLMQTKEPKKKTRIKN